MNTKNTLIAIVALFATSATFAQVGIGTKTPDASAILDVKDTTKGFLPPRMTDAQRDAMGSPLTGMTIYNTTESCLQWYDGSDWFSGCSGSLAPVPPTNPAGQGSLSGKICFDIALNNDNTNSCAPLTARTPNQSDFTQTTTNTQTYTFTPSGTVSNVRFVYINTNGNVITAISGDNTGNNISTAVAATVTFNNSLNTLAAGLTNSNPLTADIYVIYNDGATNNGTDRQLKITPNVKDCVCCGAPTSSGGFLNFMCHNLGADYTADPFTPSWRLNGAYFQWGKKPVDTNSDGYTSKLNSGVQGFAAAPTGPLLADANPSVASWSGAAAANGAWNVTEATPIKTANDPCPSGYRVPTRNEWVSIYTGVTGNWSNVGGATWTNSATNYNTGKNINNTLYLPASGTRLSSSGGLNNRGGGGLYWSSTTQSTFALSLIFSSNSSVSPAVTSNRLIGISVRCVAD